jgi:hypothetical protein
MCVGGGGDRGRGREMKRCNNKKHVESEIKRESKIFLEEYNENRNHRGI